MSEIPNSHLVILLDGVDDPAWPKQAPQQSTDGSKGSITAKQVIIHRITLGFQGALNHQIPANMICYYQAFFGKKPLTLT